MFARIISTCGCINETQNLKVSNIQTTHITKTSIQYFIPIDKNKNPLSQNKKLPGKIRIWRAFPQIESITGSVRKREDIPHFSTSLLLANFKSLFPRSGKTKGKPIKARENTRDQLLQRKSRVPKKMVEIQ